ncbi:unnamed protein product [Aphanomyces euteiches]
MPVVQFLLKHRTEGATRLAMDNAAKNNRFNVVRCLAEVRPEDNLASAMAIAAAQGHTNIVHYLFGRLKVVASPILEAAAENGHLDLVKFLFAHRKDLCTTRTLDKAAARGHVEVVRFLYENRHRGCTSDILHLRFRPPHHLEQTGGSDCHRSDALKAAQANGHVEVVKYLAGLRAAKRRCRIM